jgi:hypothetical protein
VLSQVPATDGARHDNVGEQKVDLGAFLSFAAMARDLAAGVQPGSSAADGYRG